MALNKGDAMKETGHYPDIQTFANAAARHFGCGRADHIIVCEMENPKSRSKLVNHVSYGYRKYTTGEYVPNKYLANFGWKNTYYQCAVTTIGVSKDVAKHFGII